MSRELERLLNALWEAREGESHFRPKWTATVRRMIDEALTRLPPGATSEQFRDGIELRYLEFRRARRKPPTIPPKA